MECWSSTQVLRYKYALIGSTITDYYIHVDELHSSNLYQFLRIHKVFFLIDIFAKVRFWIPVV